MRKVGKILLIVVGVVLGAVLVAVPYVVPPVVERLAVAQLERLGIPASVKLSLAYCWRNGPGIEGRLEAAVRKTPWRVTATFGASCSEWAAKLTMPETAFDERDPLVSRLMEPHPLKGVSNLVFSGKIALDAHAERTFRKPVPAWRVAVPVSGLSASLFSGDQPLAIGELSVKLCASGLADHIDIRPMFLKARSAAVGELCLTNLHATVRADEHAWIVNEAGAGFCGGRINVYSLLLNPANLNAGFTMFLDNVDAGQVLAHVNGFRGEASGRLHGKLKAFVKEGGKAVRLRDMFLYSTPGETGKLRMTNPTRLTENLSYAGFDKAARDNVADALSDLDYKVLRFDLKRTGEASACLSVHVAGTATRGNLTVPVDLKVNLNGELEQLLNAGLDYTYKLKGNKR